MPEPPDPSSNPSNVTRLLYKAVKQLPEEEQAIVFEHFFEAGIGIQRRTVREQVALWPEGARIMGNPPSATFLTAQKGAGPNQQIIPVRLSEDSHRRLKQWCGDHDFHMSVVVRGLIERFLDGWKEPGSGGPAAAAG